MVLLRTDINFHKPFWAIVNYGDLKGHHTGKAFDKIVVVECNTATELATYLSDQEVEAGESEGAYYFKRLALYSSQEQFNHDQEAEKEVANDN